MISARLFSSLNNEDVIPNFKIIFSLTPFPKYYIFLLKLVTSTPLVPFLSSCSNVDL